MLKITTTEGTKRNRVVVEGHLVVPWTTELRSECDKALAHLRDRELVVELRHLITISPEGENILLDLMNRGVKVCGSGVFAKQILKQLARKPHTSIQEVTR